MDTSRRDILGSRLREGEDMRITYREKCGYLNWSEEFEYRYNLVSVRQFSDFSLARCALPRSCK